MSISADEQALLAAVSASPNDHTPRLVYADWLEENGRADKATVMRCGHWRGNENPPGGVPFYERSPHLQTRSVYMSAAAPAVVRSVRYGVVFLMAWWSGPARQVFQVLSDLLCKLDPGAELLFVVVDIDGIGDDWIELFAPYRPPGGVGEAFWIDCGQPFLMTGVETRNRFQEAIEHLLRRKAHDESLVK